MSSANENGSDDGIGKRLAKFVFASANSPFTEFADKQRVERLNQCKQLEAMLKACEHANRPENAIWEKDDEASPMRETTSVNTSGLKISRFLGWESTENGTTDAASLGANRGTDVMREAAASFTETSGSENIAEMTRHKKMQNAARKEYSAGCARETHELWACRALALGCGQDLGKLKTCWNKSQQALVGENNGGLSNDGSDPSCRMEQRGMAHCATKNAAELAKRLEDAKNR